MKPVKILLRRHPRLISGAAALAVLLMLLAFSPGAQLAAVNFPARFYDGPVVKGLVFDQQTGLALDLYAPPAAAGPGPHPVMMFYYGGGWRQGSRDIYPFMGTLFARAGYLVAVPDYRKYPDVRFPAFVEDGAAALAWVKAHAADYGGDPGRIVLAGHSAGAHTAILLATDGRYLAAHGIDHKQLLAAVGLAGPYHFNPASGVLFEIFGPEERFRRMQVSHFVEPDQPPLLLLYGLADDTVGPENHRQLSAALDAAGACYRLITYPDIGHIDILSAYTWIHRDRQPMLQDTLAFLDAAKQGAVCGS